jgi:hypothetical protein
VEGGSGGDAKQKDDRNFTTLIWCCTLERTPGTSNSDRSIETALDSLTEQMYEYQLCLLLSPLHGTAAGTVLKEAYRAVRC